MELRNLKPNPEIVIDGSIGEGGGSILRVAAGIATFTGKRLKIHNIRKNRSKPGLKLQHLLGILALRDITGGTLYGGDIGSTEIHYSPGNDWKNQFSIQIDTAGSIGLLTQSLQYGLIAAPSNEYHFKFNGGGTFGLGAPDPFLLNNTTFKIFEQSGYRVSIHIEKEGFYPKGGAKGEIILHPPETVKAFHLEERDSLDVLVTRIVSSSKLKEKKVNERIEREIKKQTTFLNLPIDHEIISEYVDTLSPGVGVSGYLKYDNGPVLGSGTILGGIKITSEQVAQNYMNEIKKQLLSNAAVDSWTADQILPMMMMCEKESSFTTDEVTLHANTNMQILEMIFDRKFKIVRQNQCYLISIPEVS